MHAYSFNDAKAFRLQHVETLYYRLRQIDENGKAILSNVAVVNMETSLRTNNVSVFPNPFENNLMVQVIADQESTATMMIRDIAGRIVLQQQPALVKGNNLLPVDGLSNMNAGVYFLTISVNGQTETLKLIKQ
jgi:hypothetical protein